jgi:hypothetical protein
MDEEVGLGGWVGGWVGRQMEVGERGVVVVEERGVKLRDMFDLRTNASSRSTVTSLSSVLQPAAYQ